MLPLRKVALCFFRKECASTEKVLIMKKHFMDLLPNGTDLKDFFFFKLHFSDKVNGSQEAK